MKDYKHLGLEKGFKRGLAAQPRNFQSEFDQDVKMEKGAYANPTQIQKGQTDFTMGGLVNFKDASGSTILTYSPSTGAITISNNIDQTGTLTITGDLILNGDTIKGGREGALSLCSGGLSSGGAAGYYTNSTTFTSLDNTRFLLNADDYPDCEFYLECIYRAGTAGETVRTFTARLYDVTNGSAPTNGTVSGTAQEGTAGAGDLPRVRSSAITIPAADNEYIIQYKTSGTAYYVDLYQARLIVGY